MEACSPELSQTDLFVSSAEQWDKKKENGSTCDSANGFP